MIGRQKFQNALSLKQLMTLSAVATFNMAKRRASLGEREPLGFGFPRNVRLNNSIGFAV